MSAAGITWTDTTGTPPPDPAVSARIASVFWLIGRHPKLAELVDRVPGVAGEEVDGTIWFDCDQLAGAFALYDRLVRPDRRETADDRELDELAEKGEPFAASALQLGFMSPSERARLRLLAMLGSGPGVRFAAWMSDSFDDSGKVLLSDFCRALVGRYV